MKKLTIIAIFHLLFQLAAMSQTVTIGSVKFTPKSQDKKNENLYFANIAVYENNVEQKGNKINLYVEVLPAKDSIKKTPPMFIIMGGPGQGATDLTSFFGDILSEINKRSDIVFIDQRGTGKSNPLIIQTNRTSIQDYFNDNFLSNEVITSNYEVFSKSIDLSCYGTVNAIIDLDYVRDRMGYDKINIYGTSYGTRVAVAYANKFPKKTRTLTLKGLVPNDLIIPYNFAEDAQRSLDLMINHCEKDSFCQFQYKEIRKDLDIFFNQNYPVETEFFDESSNEKQTISINEDAILLTFRTLLMSPSSTKNIPYFVSEWNKGNHNPLLNTILALKKSSAKGIADGMFLCVVCYEDYPDLMKLQSKQNNNLFLKNVWINRITSACKIWNPNVQKAPKQTIKRQNIPTLLISGNKDGATPPRYGEAVAKYFPKSKHIIVEHGSHSFDGMRNCVENIICRFVIEGSVKEIDDKCVKSITFPKFK